MRIRWVEYEASEHGKKKRKEIADRYRKNNKEKIQQKLGLRIVKGRELVNSIKSVPCLDCGNTFPSCAMDLDHVRGKKKMDVSQMVDAGYILKSILEEIDKCEVVCANCHRVRTHERRIANG